MNIQNAEASCRCYLIAFKSNLLSKGFTIFLIASFLFSCDDDDSKSKGKYESGAIIVNEGGFGSANGTVTYYNTTSGEVQQNIFRNANGDFAGDVVQSISFQDDKAYLVINGDNKIEIVNASTFEGLGTIVSDDLDKPRYIEVIDNKAYISVWGPYEDGGFSLVDSYVLVVDLSNDTVVKKIETDEGTENLLYAGTYLFASNYNYGSSNSLAVISPANNTLVDQLELASGPAGLVTDANGKVWVICTGDFGASNGQLFRINPSTLTIEETIDLHINPDVDLGTTPDKSALIYSSGTSIYAISIAATAAPAEPLFEAEEVISNYALGVDPKTGDIWVADALSFTSEGKVYIYNASGSLKTSFATGIGPTQFMFK